MCDRNEGGRQNCSLILGGQGGPWKTPVNFHGPFVMVWAGGRRQWNRDCGVAARTLGHVHVPGLQQDFPIQHLGRPQSGKRVGLYSKEAFMLISCQVRLRVPPSGWPRIRGERKGQRRGGRREEGTFSWAWALLLAVTCWFRGLPHTLEDLHLTPGSWPSAEARGQHLHLQAR